MLLHQSAVGNRCKSPGQVVVDSLPTCYTTKIRFNATVGRNKVRALEMAREAEGTRGVSG